MIPKPGRCLVMTISAIVLAGGLLMAGVPGVVLLALTPGLLCLAMSLAMGHGDSVGEEALRTAPTASAGPAERPVYHARTPARPAGSTRAG